MTLIGQEYTNVTRIESGGNESNPFKNRGSNQVRYSESNPVGKGEPNKISHGESNPVVNGESK